MPQPPTPIQVDAYLRHLSENTNRSIRTIRGYGYDLARLAAPWFDWSPAAVQRYVSKKSDGTDYKPESRNRRISAIQGFARFLVTQGELDADPTGHLGRSVVPDTPRFILGVSLLKRVVAASRMPTSPSWLAARDEAIVKLFFYTGIRLAELVRLDVSQVEPESRTLLNVRRKRGRQMHLVLNRYVSTGLFQWMAVRSGTTKTDALFTSRNGGRISERSVQRRLALLGQEVALPVPLSPHVLRHEYAAALRGAEVDARLETIQLLMAHESLDTTKKYFHIDITEMRETLAKMPSIDPDEEGEECA